jgi:hypothetical protein
MTSSAGTRTDPTIPVDRPAGRIRTSREWCEYFEYNQARLLPIPWEVGVELTPPERHVVIKSLQIFQLGETGEGRHIRREADRHAIRSGDLDYPRALRMFIAEEHRHAALLGRVLDAAGVERLRRQWSNGVFRRLRHLAGLELAICVLLTAELIATIYYAALRGATKSIVLKRVCEQILRDEAMHVRFQSERLAALREGRPRPARLASVLAQTLFFTATCSVFWISHRRVLRAGGFSLRKFARRARLVFQHSTSISAHNPRSRHRFKADNL